MLDAFTLTGRDNNQMVCLLNYGSEATRGKKVVLYKHGFLGNQAAPHRMMLNLAERLDPLGYTLARFDSVGAGNSEGSCHYTTIPGEIEDTKIMFDYLRNGLEAEQLVLLGYSMGGTVGPIAGEGFDLDAMVLWSPVAHIESSFRQHMGNERYDAGLAGNDVEFGGDRVGKEFFVGLDDPAIDPLPVLAKFTKPVRVVHGDGDTDIPVSNSYAVRNTCKDVKLHVIPGANHGYDKVAWQDELFDVTVQYLEEITK